MARAGSYLLLVVAASRYWISVAPNARRELRRWRRRAGNIPNADLRAIALETARRERGNYDGASAFAAFVPRRSRTLVVRAVIAFQLAYDYADSLAEQPNSNRVANSRALHESLHAALSPDTPHPDYFAYQANRDDGGYLEALVETCRTAIEVLPAWGVVGRRAHDASRQVVEFQALNHADDTLVASYLSAFAASAPQGDSAFRWWETAAGSASSLVVFSLIAASADPSLTEQDAEAIECAYVPWIGTLHVLLDSLVDCPEDVAAGHHSLVGHYTSGFEMATRMEALTHAAVRSTRTLPRSHQHELLLIAMAGLYLTRPAALTSHAALTTERVLSSLSGIAGPVLLIHRVRSWIDQTWNRN
jgi:tetraprenyl-beta-curcumene synthase